MNRRNLLRLGGWRWPRPGPRRIPLLAQAAPGHRSFSRPSSGGQSRLHPPHRPGHRRARPDPHPLHHRLQRHRARPRPAHAGRQARHRRRHQRHRHAGVRPLARHAHPFRRRRHRRRGLAGGPAPWPPARPAHAHPRRQPLVSLPRHGHGRPPQGRLHRPVRLSSTSTPATTPATTTRNSSSPSATGSPSSPAPWTTRTTTPTTDPCSKSRPT